MSSKYASRKPKEDFVLSEESATTAVVEMLDYYGIDVEAIEESHEEAGGFLERALDTVTLATRRGILEFSRDKNGKLEVKHNLSDGDTSVIYKEISSQAKVAMDKFDSDAHYQKTYTFMGVLCGRGAVGIQKFSPRDLSIVEVLGAVFLNA